ncbi:multi-sensor hybrid histidine kinase [Pseudomonas sp. Os17]|nr:multi-sensor hybrid histidine kinase [Pseudomonas sp. Os17]BAQ81720.1 multi-sensor hybrid histidine kinase [Pseudomonas sp. St29]BCT34142.1 hypothetical protein PproGo58_36370 [Pseudomonas protegens]
MAAVSAALKRSLAMAMASAVKVKLTSPGLLRLYMRFLPKSPPTPGKGPGNWEGTLGLANDGSVTGLVGRSPKQSFSRVSPRQMS